MDIKGHAAIVTGGGSGLGAATAEELAKAGAKVALLDVNMDAANGHAKKIGGIAIKCDVSDAASAEAAIREANAKHGVARILIGRARACPVRHPRLRDRARHFLHADAYGPHRGDPRGPCGLDPVSAGARQARAVCGARAPYRGEPLSQRRSDPARWRAAHGAQIM